MSHEFHYLVDGGEIHAHAPGAFVEQEWHERGQGDQYAKEVGKTFQTCAHWPTCLDALVSEKEVEVNVESSKRRRGKSSRPSLAPLQDESRHAAGYNDCSNSELTAAEADAAAVEGCDETALLQHGDMSISPVELNAEDADGDSDSEHGFLSVKKRMSEGDRSRHMHSAEVGARFCHSSSIRGINYAALSMVTGVSPDYPASRRNDGNTALNFTNNDVTVVRAIAMMLLEEEEKKKRRD